MSEERVKVNLLRCFLHSQILADCCTVFEVVYYKVNRKTNPVFKIIEITQILLKQWLQVILFISEKIKADTENVYIMSIRIRMSR